MFRAVSALPLASRAQARASPPEGTSEDEIGALCRAHIFPYALRCLANQQDAEDVAVEVFAAALASRDKFRGEVEPRLWLLGIARRKIADVLRRRSRHRAGSIEDIGDESWAPATGAAHDPEAQVLGREALAQLRALVNGLPAPQREALLLQAIEGLSILEIARLMRRSESATNSLLGRARDTLRKRGASYFGNEFGGEG